MRSVRAALLVVSPLALLVTALTSATTARAQSPASAPPTIPLGDWQLAPLVEIRTRGEYRRDPFEMGGVDLAGHDSARVRNAYGVLERTRLGLGAEYGESGRNDHGVLRAQVTLQDARAWGVPSPASPSIGVLGGGTSGPASIGLYEAYVEARTTAARPSFIRLGRQAVTWGDGRLVSNADWSPVARTLDAARAHASLGMFDFELLAAMLEPPTPLGVSVGQTLGPSSTGSQLYGAQAGASIDPLLKIELSLLARVTRGNLGGAVGDGSTFSRARAEGEAYVGSLRVYGDSRGWRYAAEGAYELGRAQLLADADIAAWAAAAYVEKRLDGVALSPTLRLEGDYASGDDGHGGTTYRQFDPLLPDVHTLHGAMDALAWSNAMQASARVTVAPWSEGHAAIEYRYARLAEASGEWLDGYLGAVGRAPLQSSSAELGHEIDAWASWRPWPVLDLSAGYSLFVIGDGARAVLAAQGRGSVQADGSVAPASLAHSAYVQVTLRIP